MLECDMRLGEESIVIRRPLDAVFRFVADTANDPRWHTTVVEGQRTSADRLGLGTTFEGIYDSKKRTLDTPAHPTNFQHVRAVITEYGENQSLRIRVEFTDPPRGIGARVLGEEREERPDERDRVNLSAAVDPRALGNLLEPKGQVEAPPCG
jgi:hypothetical protein